MKKYNMKEMKDGGGSRKKLNKSFTKLNPKLLGMTAEGRACSEVAFQQAEWTGPLFYLSCTERTQKLSSS